MPLFVFIYQFLKKLVQRVLIYNAQFQQVHQACKAWGVAQFISEIKANIGIYIKKEMVRLTVSQRVSGHPVFHPWIHCTCPEGDIMPLYRVFHNPMINLILLDYLYVMLAVC